MPTPLPAGRPHWILPRMNAARATGSDPVNDPVKVLTVDDHAPFLEVAHEMVHGRQGSRR